MHLHQLMTTCQTLRVTWQLCLLMYPRLKKARQALQCANPSNGLTAEDKEMAEVVKQPSSIVLACMYIEKVCVERLVVIFGRGMCIVALRQRALRTFVSAWYWAVYTYGSHGTVSVCCEAV